MTGRIGYYVHHHGDGHRQRALAIAEAAPGRLTLLGTGLAGRTGLTPCLDLADDHGGAAHKGFGIGEGDSLHYAPHQHAGIRARVAAMADWIMREKPALVVVDVSVEVAMLARLASVPMAYIRLSGSRSDQPHLDAFRAAMAIIAPFHRDLDDPAVPAWVAAKTIYVPGLSRCRTGGVTSDHTVLVVNGRGGRPLDGASLAAAAAATPDKKWRAIGPVTPASLLPPNLTIAGWVDTAERDIAEAGIVIGHGGDGVVGSVIAAGRRFICLPQDRPFDEQRVKAERLRALGAAVVLPAWPPAQDWPGLLRRAENLDVRSIQRLHDPGGAQRAAALLTSLAA